MFKKIVISVLVISLVSVLSVVGTKVWPEKVYKAADLPANPPLAEILQPAGKFNLIQAAPGGDGLQSVPTIDTLQPGTGSTCSPRVYCLLR